MTFDNPSPIIRQLAQRSLARLLPILAGVSVFGVATPAFAQTTAPMFPGKTQTTPIPDEFKDPETHLRVVHLSRFPADYASVIYFTYNTFSPDSRLTLINQQFAGKWRYLYSFDFDTMTARPLVTDRLTQNQDVTIRSGNVYYQADQAVWTVPLAGGVPRKICDLPAHWQPGTGFSVNADETLLMGGTSDIDRSTPAGQALIKDKKRSDVLFTVNLKTGEIKVIHRENAWLGHVQFSPTDPDLAMFCHEGNWERVDRIWLINPSKSTAAPDGTVTSNASLAYQRTEPREIVGHEFWHPSGKSIWFQQSFRANPDRGSYLTSKDLQSGKITQYRIPKGFGGIHETFSPDGSFLIADGGGRKGDTHPGPGKYISKLTLPTDGSDLLKGEHLVSLHANDYAVEPNPHVSPDNRWVTFTATLHGTAQAYAVELPASETTPKTLP